MVFARHLDRAFHRLGAGIAEENDVGEARLAQPRGDALGLGNLVEVGDVPDLLRLLGDGGDEPRMSMAERVDGDAGAEIEVALAVGGDEPRALAPLKSKIDARIGRQQMRCHGRARLRRAARRRAVKQNVPPLRAARIRYFSSVPSSVNTRNGRGKPGCPQLIHIRSGNVWTCDAGTLARRLPPYCSLLIVEYDISCGGQSSTALVKRCVLGGCALPGSFGDSVKRPRAQL